MSALKKLIKSNKDGVEYYSVENLIELQDELLYLLLIIDEVCKENNLQYWLDGGTLLGLQRHGGFIPWDDDLDICLLKKDYDKLLPLLYERVKNDERCFLYFYKSKNRFWCEYLATTRYGKLNKGKLQPYRIDIFPMKLVKNCEVDIKEDRKIGDIAGYYVLGKSKFNKDIKKKLSNEGKVNIDEKNKFLDYYNNIYMMRYQEIEIYDGFLLKKGHGNFSPLEFIEYNSVFPLNEGSFQGHKVPVPNKTHEYLIKSYGDYMQLPPFEKRKPVNEKIVELIKSKNETVEDLRYELDQIESLFKVNKIKQKMESFWWYLKNGELLKIFKIIFHLDN